MTTGAGEGDANGEPELATAGGDRATLEWVIVVPFKGTDLSKTRLAELPATVAFRRRLALAFALDTVTALAETEGVVEILVVSNDAASAAALLALSPTVSLVRDPGEGLNRAISAGLAEARRRRPSAAVAAITADLPSLTTSDVQAALTSASRHPFSFVADLAGTGTTTIAALPGHGLVPRFGIGSAQAHEAHGLVRLTLATGSTLRRDVDTPADLDADRLAFGPYTRSALTGPSLGHF